MKAIVQERFGPPEVLQLVDTDPPEALGAEVTGVCSTRNAGLVRSIGAAHVVDYTTQDFTDGRERYDVILDNVGNRPLSRLRRALTPAGTLVLNGGGAARSSSPAPKTSGAPGNHRTSSYIVLRPPRLRLAWLRRPRDSLLVAVATTTNAEGQAV